MVKKVGLEIMTNEPSNSTQLKNWTESATVFRPWKTGNIDSDPWEKGKRQDELRVCPGFLPGDSFPATRREVNPKQRPRLPELKWQKPLLGAAEAAGVCRSGFRRGVQSTTGVDGEKRVEGGRGLYRGSSPSFWSKKVGVWAVHVQSETLGSSAQSHCSGLRAD